MVSQAETRSPERDGRDPRPAAVGKVRSTISDTTHPHPGGAAEIAAWLRVWLPDLDGVGLVGGSVAYVADEWS